MDFLDRVKERNTLRKTLDLNREVLVVIYGRRRVGKSELIKKVLTRKDIYHLSDATQPCHPLSCLLSGTVRTAYQK